MWQLKRVQVMVAVTQRRKSAIAAKSGVSFLHLKKGLELGKSPKIKQVSPYYEEIYTRRGRGACVGPEFLAPSRPPFSPDMTCFLSPALLFIKRELDEAVKCLTPLLPLSLSTDYNDLDEDDLDLIEENLGVKVKRRVKRLFLPARLLLLLTSGGRI